MPARLRALAAAVLVAVAGLAVPAAAHPPGSAAPITPGGYVAERPRPGSFPLAARGRAAPILVDAGDFAGVRRAAGDLRADVERVTGLAPEAGGRGREVVIVGTLGRSPLVDDLARRGKIDVRGVAGKWETAIQQVVPHPAPGVRQALVIAGSDQRGTIFGVYDVAKSIGVSPWHWWDDVPPRRRAELHVLPGRHTQGTPAVKYRGFFINDENPALGRWAPRYFGPGHAPGHPNGFNSAFYGRVFETMLRLKANYLWPAVWGRAFAEDDPANHRTATEYGVVMGTSHEAPMMRGIEEWNRHAVPAVRDADGTVVTPGRDPYGGTGEWSFRRNRAAIEAYWTDGVRRMVAEGFEGVVTLGMRGNGDVSLPDGDGIELMSDIIATQRAILDRETGGAITGVPQVQTLYKEVQRYWDRGYRPPDDVTVVFCDDNWSNMRKLPAGEPRAGGYGMYYHFDYVGGGRNYKWADTMLLPNVWEQLDHTYQSGVDRLWVVNVGDMKNQELPLQFFLDYAWKPIPQERLHAWERAYAAQNFGPGLAGPIADVLREYGKLQSDRKPELLNRRITVDPAKDIATDPSAVVYDDRQTPFSVTNYRELERVTDQWQELARRTERIRRAVPARSQDAFYQLVYYQIAASANLYELREANFTNLLYAQQGRAAANDLADVAEARFAEDQAMSDYYNHTLVGGKWAGFQTQPKIGYGDVERYGPNAPWQQPERDHEALPDEIYPAVRRVELPARAELGVGIDGSDQWWPNAAGAAVLPEFSRHQAQPPQYIEVFNRGSVPFDYRIETGVPWLRVDKPRGEVDTQVRATLTVDWRTAPPGKRTVPVTVTGAGRAVTVQAVVDATPVAARGFVEANGYVSVEADHYSRAVGGDGVRWVRIDDIGRTGNGMEPYPLRAPRQTPGGDSPRLEYEVTLKTAGPVRVLAYLSPRNNVLGADGLEYAVSIDGQPPQVVDITAATGADDTTMNKQWERNTSDNVNLTETTHVVDRPGRHVLKFWMVDPTVVVQKMVIDTGGLLPSYLGPPESAR